MSATTSYSDRDLALFRRGKALFKTATTAPGGAEAERAFAEFNAIVPAFLAAEARIEAALREAPA